MGFLTKISELFRSKPGVQQLPLGSLTVDRSGQVVTTTISSGYPKAMLRDIGRDVVSLFQEARTARLPMSEISLHFGSLRITARELRGGAIIFIFPQTALSSTSK